MRNECALLHSSLWDQNTGGETLVESERESRAEPQGPQSQSSQEEENKAETAIERAPATS